MIRPLHPLMVVAAERKLILLWMHRLATIAYPLQSIHNENTIVIAKTKDERRNHDV